MCLDRGRLLRVSIAFRFLRWSAPSGFDRRGKGTAEAGVRVGSYGFRLSSCRWRLDFPVSLLDRCVVHSAHKMERSIFVAACALPECDAVITTALGMAVLRRNEAGTVKEARVSFSTLPAVRRTEVDDIFEGVTDI